MRGKTGLAAVSSTAKIHTRINSSQQMTTAEATRQKCFRRMKQEGLWFKFHLKLLHNHTCLHLSSLTHTHVRSRKKRLLSRLPPHGSFMKLYRGNGLDVRRDTGASLSRVTPTDGEIKNTDASIFILREVEARHGCEKEEFHLHYSRWCGVEHVSGSAGRLLVHSHVSRVSVA